MLIVPIEKTFFVAVDFTSNQKLSYEAVLFNYQNLSPYQNSAVSYLQKGDKLLLWFYEKENHHIFTVPEGFFYYHFFLQEGNDNTLIKIKDKLEQVILDSILVYQTSSHTNSTTSSNLLSKKYAIKNIIEKTQIWNNKTRKKILNRPIWILINNFLDRKRFFDLLKQKAISLLIPLFVVISMMSAAHFVLKQYLQKELSYLSKQKQKTKKQIGGIFTKIQKNNNDIMFIEKYLHKYNSLGSDILISLANIAQSQKAKYYYFIYNAKFITLRLEIKNIENFLEALSKIEKIDSYRVTRQVKTKDGINDLSIEITLKGNMINE